MSARRINVLELRSVRGTGGGPEKTILAGAARADRSRFAVTVCYVRDSRDEIFRIDQRAQALPIDYVEVIERHSFDPSIWKALMAVVRDREIDIIHGHDYKTDLLAWLLARRTAAVAMATAHGWTGQSARERQLYYPAHKRLLARFPAVVAVSTDIRDELVRLGANAERMTVILNGIDPVAFRREASRRDGIRASLGVSPSDIVIGAVGRLERQKRFDLLLDAVAQLAPEHQAVRLVLVGDGSLRTDLESHAAALGLTERCRFLGHRDDIVSLHHAFDVFAQSSEYEGTPNAVLEAMAMETPIVATSAGGTHELAAPDVHALIVPVGDVEALRQGIESVLRDPNSARTRAAAARQRVEHELSFEARTRRLEAIYTRLFDEHGRVRVPSGEGARSIRHETPHA